MFENASKDSCVWPDTYSTNIHFAALAPAEEAFAGLERVRRVEGISMSGNISQTWFRLAGNVGLSNMRHIGATSEKGLLIEALFLAHDF